MGQTTQELRAIQADLPPQDLYQRELEELIDAILIHEKLRFSWVTRDLVEKMFSLETNPDAQKGPALKTLLTATAARKTVDQTVDFFLSDILTALRAIYEAELKELGPTLLDKKLLFFGKNIKLFLKPDVPLFLAMQHLENNDIQSFKNCLHLGGKVFINFYFNRQNSDERRQRQILKTILNSVKQHLFN